MKLNENNKVWKKFTEKKEELAISDEENLIVISRLMSKLPERFPIPNQQNISENGGQMPLRDSSQCEIEKKQLKLWTVIIGKISLKDSNM